MKSRGRSDQAQLRFPAGSPDHVSYSQISDYQRCPRLWALQKLGGYQQPESRAMALGKAIHYALALYSGAYKNSGVHSAEDMQLCWRQACENLNEQAPLPVDDYGSGASTLQALLREGMLDLDWVLHVEYDFRAKFDGINVEGRIDRVDESETGYLLVDYKSGYQIVDRDVVERDLQLAIYATAWREVSGAQGEDISVAMLNTRTMTYAEALKTDEELDAVKDYVIDMATRMGKDHEALATPGDSCLMYGGCWAASLCPAISLTLIPLQGGSIDLLTVSNEKLLEAYRSVEIWMPKIRAALRGRMADEGFIETEDLRAELVPRTRTSQRSDVMADFVESFSRYGLDISNCARMDKKSLDAERGRVSQAILEDTSLDWESKRQLMDDMCLMVDAMFESKATTPGITVVRKMEEKMSN